jgi:amphi-Trp domain-containing protein
MSSREFEHDSLQDPRSVARYLNAIREGIEAGRLSFTQDGEEISFFPQEVMHLEVKAKKKDGKAKLSIRITWRETDGEIIIPKMAISSSE